ncbi:MAG: hypoxanthine phosphoribosyltransferase [Dehalococcoidales bacterium]|nr:hypoxanthine phosphoribosyltransferase [Dehalococcoidales bacterium]
MSAQAKRQILLSRQEIEVTVGKLAAEIKIDYQDKNPLLIGILKGSFVFLADLIRLLNFPLEVEFVRLSSYGRGRSAPGKLKVVQGLHTQIKDRDVLVVEDIVDTGHSAAFLMDYLRKKKPASLKLCALTDKPSRREVTVTIDYLGFTVPNKFIVGYGIDWDEKFRYLPDICYLETEKILNTNL